MVRRCTDILCLLFFIAYIAAMVVLGVVSVNKDPSLLTDIVYPKDSYGNNCGHSDGVDDMPKLIYPQLDDDIKSQYAILAAGRYWDFKPTKICAKDCPDGFSLKNPTKYGGSSYPTDSGSAPSWYYVFRTQDVIGRCFPYDTTSDASSTQLCVEPACTDSSLNSLLDNSVVCTSIPSEPDADNVWTMCGAGVSVDLCNRQKAACELAVDQDTKDTFTPAAQSTDSTDMTEKLAFYMKTLLGAIEGMLVTKGYVTILVTGVAAPFVLGFVWAIFLRFFAGVFVYLCILLMVCALIIVDFYLAVKAGWFDDVYNFDNIYNTSLNDSADESERKWFMAATIICTIVTVIVLLLIIMWRKCIRRLIAIIKESSKVFKAMPIIVFWPLWYVLLSLGIFAYGLFILYFLIYVWEDVKEKAATVSFHILGILWLIQTTKATVWTSMAGAIANWFKKPSGNGGKCCRGDFGGAALCASTCMVVTKHLGSMAFGAAIIAICQFIRLVLEGLDYMTREKQKKNLLLWFAMKCVKCCMWCVQKTIEFISYYGFIFVAVEGSNFCKACFQTFGFILKNPAQTIVNKTVQKLLKILIGYSTPVLCASAAFYYLGSQEDYDRDYDPLWACAAVFILAYIIAGGLCMVFDVCIDTIYICAFTDPASMPPDMRKGFGLDVAEDEISRKPRAYNKMKEREKETAEVSPDE